MRIAVIGSNGRTGRAFADPAEQAGHQVVRVTRSEADATDAHALRPLIAGADAVVSCVGPTKNAANGILEASTRALLEAGATRLMTVSASGPYTNGDGFFLARIVKPLLWNVFGGTWQDMRESDTLLRQSSIEWTSMQPPQLTDKPARGYRRRLGRNVARGIRITRADLAQAMLDALGDPATIRERVSVAN